MKNISIPMATFLVVSSLSVQAEIIDYLTLVPDPLSGINPLHSQQPLSFPTAGTQFTEPSFGLGITRLTNDETEGSRHEYSRFDPYNKDQSRILLNNSGGTLDVYKTEAYPYNSTGNKLHSLSVTEARWDRNDVNKIWGLSDSSIKTVNATTGATSVIKNFSTETTLTAKLGSDFTISMKGEGESSYDNRHWAFVARSNANTGNFKGKEVLFTWDKDANQVLGTYELSTRERDNIDWVGMSPNGNYVLVGSIDYNNPTNGQIIGLAMANKNFTNFSSGPDNGKKFHRLNYDTAHSDVGLDSEGKEVIVMQNTRTDFIDLIPIDPTTVSINDIPLPGGTDAYANTNRTKLVRLNYDDSSSDGLKASGVHISGNYDGYALISTTISPNVAEQNWLDRVILLVKLDQFDAENPETPLAGYISKIYNTTGTIPNALDGNYWEETQGVITNDGAKVLWSANWDIDGTGNYYGTVGPFSEQDNFLLEADLTIASVPIPGAFFLLGSGLIGLAGFSSKHKKQ